MLTNSDILNTKVSYQVNTWSKIDRELTIELVLNQIKSDQYKNQIETLRYKLSQGDKEYYDNNKKQLPAVTFSATFNINRTSEYLKNYNSIIVIDIDKLNENQIRTTYENLIEDPYVFAFWRSPSNYGFKGLVSISFQVDDDKVDLYVKHKCAFNKLSKYFQDKYYIELDKSGSDITRLCFLSFDHLLVRKLSFENFVIEYNDLEVEVKSNKNKNLKLSYSSNLDALHNPKDKNNPFDRKLMTDIIRYLTNKNLSITNSFNDWCKVAMSISNTFTFEIGLNYFTKLSKLDVEKFNSTKCSNFLINCYETRNGKVNFSTIIFLANQKGYKTKYQKNGVPKVEV